MKGGRIIAINEGASPGGQWSLEALVKGNDDPAPRKFALHIGGDGTLFAVPVVEVEDDAAEEGMGC